MFNFFFRILLISLIIFLISLGIGASRYLGLFSQNSENLENQIKDTLELQGRETVKTKLEVVATGLQVPWSIVFTDQDRILLTERPGRIREVKAGVLTNKPLITFEEVSNDAEEGLMGLTKDPEYSNNRLLYASLAYPEDNKLYVKVVKLIDKTTSISLISTIIEKIPAEKFHAGSRIKFGPDKKLYITTGDATDKILAQDLNSLAGKILRINTDGSIPTDNPFVNSLIYTYGHRNSQGLDWHPEENYLISTEHGPSLFDGPAGGDEINYIQAGKNYGWPIISHNKSKTDMESPLIQYTPAVAPASGVFYKGDLIPQYKDKFLFGGLRGEGIYWVIFNKNKEIFAKGKIDGINFGRIRDVEISPAGEIYFTTSNRDGRGKPKDEDDRLIRIVPDENN